MAPTLQWEPVTNPETLLYIIHSLGYEIDTKEVHGLMLYAKRMSVNRNIPECK